MLEGDPIIKLTNVSFSYGGVEVLCCVNLAVNTGDYLGIIGPNGGGKTTLLKLILGLLQPTQGSITLFGKDHKIFTERSMIGYVPQKTSSFDSNFPATVFEVVLMGRYARRGLFHMVRNEDRKAAELALRRVGMWEYRKHPIGKLSGGQGQRVFIARALVNDPKILFLDEPTAGVDHDAQEDFYALLDKLHKEEKLTIVLVSHDLSVMKKVATHLASVDRELTYYDSPEKFMDNSQADMLLHGHDH